MMRAQFAYEATAGQLAQAVRELFHIRPPQFRGIYGTDISAASSRGPLLACCGQWHPVDAVPLRAPCCGRTYFEEGF